MGLIFNCTTYMYEISSHKHIKKLKDGKVTVDFNGNEVEAYAGLVDVKEGDYALVHAGCVIQTLKKDEAEEIIELMGDFA